MRKIFLILAATFMVMVSLVASCSKKEKTVSKKTPPPGHQKIVEEMKKNLEQSKDILVATVNGEKIHMSDLVREMNVVEPNFVRPGQSRSAKIDKEVRKAALDVLIFRSLAVQEARKQGIKVNQQTVDKVINNIKTRAGSEKAFKDYLVFQALTEADLRKLIADDNLFQQITKKEILDKVRNFKPSEKRLREVYNREKNAFILPRAYVVEDVFFAESKKDEKTRKKAENVLAEIKAKGNDLSKLSPGDGFVIRKMLIVQNMFPSIYSSLAAMKPGEVSGIIEERDGLHIVKDEGEKPARPATFKEARHIIEQQLINQAVEKRKEEWENQLKKEAKIDIVLKGDGGINPVY